MIDASVQQRVRRALSLPTATPVSAKDTDGDLWIVRGTTRNYTGSLNHQTYGGCCPCRDHELQRELQSAVYPVSTSSEQPLTQLDSTAGEDRKYAALAYKF